VIQSRERFAAEPFEWSRKVQTRTASGTDFEILKISINTLASDEDFAEIEKFNRSVDEIDKTAKDLDRLIEWLFDQPAGGLSAEEANEHFDRVRLLKLDLLRGRQDAICRRVEILASVRTYRTKAIEAADTRLVSERKKGRRKIENLGDAVLARSKSVNPTAYALSVAGRTEALTGVGEARGELQAAKAGLNQLSHADSKSDQAAARLRDDWAQFVQAEVGP
jgi:hypothetical protein